MANNKHLTALHTYMVYIFSPRQCLPLYGYKTAKNKENVIISHYMLTAENKFSHLDADLRCLS